ncbi:MAG: regulatory protein FmdB family [Gemmatimonadetes bacterium]|nr:regulatory protein FmdB family [Gemmatimonadota bacterium]
MPTYEFRCPEGHQFEKFYRSIGSAESVVACPVCGETAERMMSAAGFAFKGSGFYLTDYGKNAHRGEAPPDAGKSGESGAKESASDSAAAPSASSGSEAKSDAPKAESKSTESAAPKSEASKPEPKPAEKKAAPATKPSKSE